MYAVIDIGSNSMRLVLYKLADGEPRQMLNSKQPAGLAGYIDKEQQLTPRGVQKAVEVLQRFQAILDSVHPKRVYVFATASLRNIINTQEVLEEIRRICGLEVRVLTGQEEAIFDYFGALRTLNGPDGLLVDIGGGSTELVLFHDRQVTSACSLPMGSLNMYTRFVRDIIPTADELRDISRHAESLLKTVEFPAERDCIPALYGVGGTCRASCSLNDELYGDQSGYGGYPCKRIHKMLKRLKTDRRELLSAIVKTVPDRLHTLLPGLAILEAVANRYQCRSFAASPYGVREGYLMYMLEEESRHD